MLTEMYHSATYDFMSIKGQNIHANRMHRLITLLRCKTQTELRNILNKNGEIVFRSNLVRWRKQGMTKSAAAVIDALLDKSEELELKARQLELEIERLELEVENNKRKLKKAEKKLEEVA